MAEKPAKKSLEPRKSKRLEAVVDAALAEPEATLSELVEKENLAGPTDEVMAHVPPEMTALPENQSGLLAHFPDGQTREPTKEELVEMGKAMVECMFGNPVVQELMKKAAAEATAPPKPKISGNHCRLCKSFLGDDPRGALWSEGGLCATYAHVQVPVSPEHYCQRFVFNEALRDAEPR